MAAKALSQLPSCALSCLLTTVANSTCGITDIHCVCSQPVLFNEVGHCALQSCTVKEALTAKNASYAVCEYPTYDSVGTYTIVPIVGITLVLIAVSLRLYARTRITAGPLGLDDWTIILATGFAVGITAMLEPLKRIGLGKDIWRLPFENISRVLFLFWVEELLYLISIGIIKVSIVLFYLRLIPHEPFRIAAFICIGFSVLFTLGYMISQIFLCNPISLAWQGWDHEHPGKCGSSNAIVSSHAGVNILLDLVLLILPIPVILRLQLNSRKKIGICLMFGVGIFVSIVSILRLRSLIPFMSSSNPTKDFIPIATWSTVEVDVGIICACMPGIRALLVSVWPAAFGSTAGNSVPSKNTKSKRNSMMPPRIGLPDGSSGSMTGVIGDRDHQFFELSEMNGSQVKSTILTCEKASSSVEDLKTPVKEQRGGEFMDV